MSISNDTCICSSYFTYVRVHGSLTRPSLLDEWHGFKCYTHNMSYQRLRHKLNRHIQAERKKNKPSTPSNRYIKYWDQSKAYQVLLENQ